MAKLTDEELREIVEEQLPGYTTVQRATDVDAAPSLQATGDAVSPTLEALQQRHGKGTQRAPGDAGTPETSADADAEDTEVEDALVVIAPKRTNNADTWERGAGPKTAVVSGAKRRIVGVQG